MQCKFLSLEETQVSGIPRRTPRGKLLKWTIEHSFEAVDTKDQNLPSRQIWEWPWSVLWSLIFRLAVWQSNYVTLII